MPNDDMSYVTGRPDCDGGRSTTGYFRRLLRGNNIRDSKTDGGARLYCKGNTASELHYTDCPP